MSLLNDLKVLFHMALSSNGGATHAERLEGFYEGQAAAYDDFRKRLLHGREELFGFLDPAEGGVWLDMGGGTGTSLEFMGEEKLSKLGKAYVVDLAPSLLEVARQRIAAHGWNHVEAVEADVTACTPPEQKADLITFSYSLTMIPDWFAAVDHALELLKPGGVIGVVDFYVSRKHPDEGHQRHRWATRSIWPLWFARDNVFLSADHVPYLQNRFEQVHFVERRGKIPYLPLAKMPYYIFAGRKATA